MIQNKVIGLTGGIASGKSTVSNLLREKGYYIIDADLVAREIVEFGKAAYLDIVAKFGQKVLNEDRSLNRKKLGDIVFNDAESLKCLNKITHKRIYERIIEYIYESDEEIVFLDIPLLFETYEEIVKGHVELDYTILVYTPKEKQVERLMKRNRILEEEARSIIDSQMDIEEKVKLADIVIDNSKDLKELEIELDIALEKILDS